MLKKPEKSFEDLLNECSKQLIEKDGITLLNYILAVSNNGMVVLSLLPYIALYCRSAQEFFQEKIIEDELDKQINDLRNGLKIYSGRYNKAKEKTLSSDEHQNDIFGNMLRFPFMKRWNIHYNLGVYFDRKGHVIGNTQIQNYFLNIPIIKEKNLQSYVLELGRILGEKIGIILMEVCGLKTLSWKEKIISLPDYGYRDFNTNRKNDFFNNKIDKELNLILLHILSSIGFIEHILCLMLPKDNLWVFRVEYVTAHFVWSGLKKIKQHFDNNNTSCKNIILDISLMVEKGKGLFPSEFRNCMMHYNLCNKGKPVILEEEYNFQKPFYGLIESCFQERSYDELVSELRSYMLELEECLLSWFHVDVNKIKWH